MIDKDKYDEMLRAMFLAMEVDPIYWMSQTPMSAGVLTLAVVNQAKRVEKLEEQNARMLTALRRIAIYDDNDCNLDSEAKTYIAREALR